MKTMLTFSFQFGMTSIGCNVQGALAVSDHIGIVFCISGKKKEPTTN